MAFLLDNILRVPGMLLGRIVKVKKGSTQRMSPPPQTTPEPGARTRRAGKLARRCQTGEDLEWPRTVSLLDNTLLTPLKFIRWVVNKVRKQVDLEITNESEAADESAPRSRPGSAARRRAASSDRKQPGRREHGVPL